MADSVVKIRIDSKEYDANIKRAGEALTQYFNRVREGGNTLEHLDESVLDAVKAMGELGTKSDSTRGAMRELLQATADMTVQYRSLTDAERATPLGAAMAQSIAQMTERAGELSDAMGDVSASIQHAASDTRRFDQAAGAISLMTSGLQTAVGAANLLGIEIGNQEKVLATLASALAITNGLQTAQNLLQSQSALMMGVQAAQASIAAAAQSALAAATGSATIAQKAFNVVANANPYVLLATAVVAVGSALFAFASAADEAEKEAEELAKAEEEAKKKADDARNAFVNASAEAMNSASRLSSLQVAYMKANSEMEKTSILKQAQEQFKKLGFECKDLNDAQNLLIRDGAKVIELIRLQGNVAALSAVRMEAFKNSFKMLMENGYSASAAASLAGYNREVLELDGQITQMQGRIQGLRGSLPMASGGGKGGGGSTTTVNQPEIIPEGSLKSLTAEMQELQKAQQLVTSTAEWRTYELAIEGVRNQIRELKGELGIDALRNVKGFSISDIVSVPTRESIQKKGDAAIRNFKLPEQTKNEVKLTEVMGQMSSGISSMVSGIEGLGIELPKGMKDMLVGIQTVTSILTGISTILTVIESISAADAIIPFASGGVVKAASGYRVPGRAFSGDMIPARLNAGELVLNQAQAGIIANALQDREFGGGSGMMQPYVDGESIFLGMNNTSKRMGRGEIVTTGTLRRLGLI